jgi:hypothetical protein
MMEHLVPVYLLMRSLSAQALSLRFSHEKFCDGLYVHRKTPSLAIFVRIQAAFLTAG